MFLVQKQEFWNAQWRECLHWEVLRAANQGVLSTGKLADRLNIEFVALEVGAVWIRQNILIKVLPGYFMGYQPVTLNRI